jgi:DNA-directed RNA polymerase sigma subunit (sigma70/sigma32)
MGERIEFGVLRGKRQLRAVKRSSGTTVTPRDLVASLWTRVATRRLISWPDAANCRDLQEQTRVLLSTLTDHEQQVLRMRFGIGAARHCSVDEIAQYYALTSDHIREIEAQALRKLRHPAGRPLRSVNRT